MPAESKSQQRTMGMVYAYKKGELDLKDLTPSLAKKIKDIADGTKRKTGDKRKKTKGISMKDAKAFASTKHKGLPEKVEEKIITKFDRFVNEASKPLPVAHKINGKWEVESFDGLKEVVDGWDKFEIISAKRDPGYGYDHVVMLFIKFLDGTSEKDQVPEDIYGLCIYDMDKHEFIEEPGSLEDYGITLDSLEKKTGFSIPE